MFSGRYRLYTLITLLAGVIVVPIMFLLDGETLAEALYVGIPMGLVVGFITAAVHWRIEELAWRRRF